MGGRGAFLKIRNQAGFKKPVIAIVWYRIGMTKFIDENQFYWITDVTHICCDEVQFKYVCRACRETMDCYYCGFDYTESHCHDSIDL